MCFIALYFVPSSCTNIFKYEWKFGVLHVCANLAEFWNLYFVTLIIFVQIVTRITFVEILEYPIFSERNSFSLDRAEAEIPISVSFEFRTEDTRHENSALFPCISQEINAKYGISISHLALRWSRLSSKISTLDSRRYDLSEKIRRSTGRSAGTL